MLKLSVGRHCMPASQHQLLSDPWTDTRPSWLCGWNGNPGLPQVRAGLTPACAAAPKLNEEPKSSALVSVTSVRWWITPTPSEKRSVTAQAPDTVKSTVLTSDLIALS